MEASELKEVIKRQTDYSDECIEEKLKEYDNDVVNIIREYLNKDKKADTKNDNEKSSKNDNEKSSNQERYKMIRDLMDGIELNK